MQIKAIFTLEKYDPVHGRDVINEVFGRGRKERIAALVDLYPEVITRDNIDRHADLLRDVEVIFSTWGMMKMGPADFAAMPNLKIVFYAAGTVRNFAEPLLDRGIRLCSAWPTSSSRSKAHSKIATISVSTAKPGAVTLTSGPASTKTASLSSAWAASR